MNALRIACCCCSKAREASRVCETAAFEGLMF
jgi:hypothetical protein